MISSANASQLHALELILIPNLFPELFQHNSATFCNILLRKCLEEKSKTYISEKVKGRMFGF